MKLFIALIVSAFSFSALADGKILAQCRSKQVNIVDAPNDNYLMTFSSVEGSTAVVATVTDKSGKVISRFQAEPNADLVEEGIYSLGVDYAPGQHPQGLSRQIAAFYKESGSGSWAQYVDCSSTVEAEFTCEIAP